MVNIRRKIEARVREDAIAFEMQASQEHFSRPEPLESARTVSSSRQS